MRWTKYCPNTVSEKSGFASVAHIWIFKFNHEYKNEQTLFKKFNPLKACAAYHWAWQ